MEMKVYEVIQREGERKLIYGEVNGERERQQHRQ